MRMLIILFLAMNSFLTANPGDTEIYLILFDVTGSMEGKGDGRGIRIFEKAKEAVTFFINEVPDDNYIFIYPFHAGLSDNRFQSIIRSGYGRKKAIGFVTGLKAEGSLTWITESYRSALEETKAYLRLHRVTAARVHVFLFTDGKGNHVNDSNIDNFLQVHADALADLPLNTRFVAIGDIFQPAELNKLIAQQIGVYSFERDKFNSINTFITFGVIDSSNGNFRIPYKITSDPKMNGTKIGYSITIDQVKQNIKPEFSKEDMNQIYSQLDKCKSFNNNDFAKFDAFLKNGNELKNDDIALFDTKIKDCDNISDKDKEKLSKLLHKDYMFTRDQVNKLNMDSIVFNKQGTEITSNRAADTISVKSAKVNEVMDSLFNSALDTNKVNAFLKNKDLTGELFLTQEGGAALDKDKLVMFPDNKIPFSVPLNKKSLGKTEHAADKSLFGIPPIALYIVGMLLLAVGLFFGFRYYQTQKLKAKTSAYKDADIKEYIHGKPDKVELCQALTPIIRELESRLHGVQVETRIRSVKVTAYPASVNFVLKELLTNAVDAMGTFIFETEKKLSIETFEDAKYGSIRITNTGGIPMDKEGVIFRDRYSTKNNRGLGLIYCHKIISANKGRIRYEGVSKLRTNEFTRITEVVNAATIMTVDLPK